jgi:foldase protein PrsA
MPKAWARLSLRSQAYARRVTAAAHLARAERNVLSDIGSCVELHTHGRSALRPLVATVVALLTVGQLTACGDAPSESVAVRIDRATIGTRLVGRWAKTIERGGEVDSSLVPAQGSARERALEFLISAAWLRGEVADRGLSVPAAEVERRLREQFDAYADRRSEFEKEIAHLGQTIDDVKLAIWAEIAVAVLRRAVSRQVRPVTRADVVSYYTGNLTRFRVPQARITDLIYGLPSRSAAAVLGKRLGPGRRFAARALNEELPLYTPSVQARKGNTQLIHAIFTAKPGTLVGPTRFGRTWVLAVVRRVIPARIKPIATVEGEIATRLSRERHRLALLGFVRAYRSKWRARTACRPGYVVQKCAQYHGPIAREGNPLAGY